MSAVATAPPPPAVATATKTLIMIVEDTPFWQKQIDQAIQAAGYATITAANGVEALMMLETQKPALIISDIEMPQMSGLEMLNALRGKPQWQTLPVILLTTGAVKERILEATRLKAAEFMLKGSFSADQLADRVKKWLNQPKPAAKPAATKTVANTFPRLLQKGEVMAGITAQVTAGKTLPNVIKQTLELCKTSQNNPSALLDIVRFDPILAMRVVQLANGSKRVGTIEDAVRAVGADGVRDIAQSLTPYPETSRSPLMAWQHSVAVASIMHRIVPRSFEVNVGITYLIGLLHDLPEILLRQAFPSQYEAALDYSDQASRPLRHVTNDIFSVSMADIASELVTLLKLPPLIATTLREYAAASGVASQGADRSGPMMDRLSLALRFAEYYANALQLPLTSSPSDAWISPLTSAECRAAYVSTEPISGTDIRESAIANCRKLNGETAETAEVKATGRPKLWYTRHNSYTALDPVEEALKRFAEIEIHSEPPSKREQFAALSGVVVCAPSFDSFGTLWHLNDRMGGEVSAGRNRVLYIVPPSASDSKRPTTEGIAVMRYPFSFEALRDSIKLFGKSEG